MRNIDIKKIKAFVIKNKSYILSGLFIIVFLVAIKFIFFPTILPNSIIKQISDNKYENVNPDFRVVFEKNGELKVKFEAEGDAHNPFTSDIKSKDDNYFKKGIEMSLTSAKVNFYEEQISESKNKLKKAITDRVNTAVSDEPRRKEFLEGYLKSLNEIFQEYEESKGEVQLIKANGRDFNQDAVVNNDAILGVDVEYTIVPGKGLKENIILKPGDTMGRECLDKAISENSKTLIGYCKLPKNEFEYEFKLDEGLRLESAILNEKKFYYITDSENRYIAHIDRLFAFDRNNKETNNVVVAVEKLEGNIYKVKTLTDIAWLLDSERVYPVIIDPTIIHDTSAEFATGQFNRTIDTGSGSSPILNINNQEQPADLNTAALYHFNNGACTTDSSGNAQTLTAVGGMTCSTGGKFDFKASGFAVTPVRYTLPTTVFNKVLPTGSIEAWINPANLSAVQTIIIADSTTDTLVTLGTSGQINFQTSGSTNLATANSVVSTNTWTHVAVTWNASGHRIYINGAQKAADVVATTHSNQVYASYIGIGAGGNTLPFSGSIDDVRVSYVARTPEEIKTDGLNRSYGIFTSDIIDFTSADNVWSWNTWMWSEDMVNSAEMVNDDTSLVGAWNLNETSGTLAANSGGPNSCGGTPSNCDGTLTSVANTSGQDVSATSGWTAINRKAGAGAVYFDNTDDFVDIPGPVAVDVPTNGNFSAEAWIQTTANGDIIFLAQNAAPVFYFSVGPTTVGGTNNVAVVYVRSDTSPTVGVFNGVTRINDGKWHHVAATATTSGATRIINIYVDAKLDSSGTYAGTGATGPFTFSGGGVGADLSISAAGGGFAFNGPIDSVRYWKRALTLDDIATSYYTSALEFQTRVGTDTSPDDGSGWEEWRPVTNETAIYSFDNTISTETLNSTYDSSNTYLAVQDHPVDQVWHKSNNAIEAANNVTGTDGRIPLGLAGSGDDAQTYEPVVIKDGNLYKMWYSGGDGTSDRIYYATSSDGLTWTKYDNSIPANSDSSSVNGKIPLGSNTTGDDLHTRPGTVIKDGSTYKMWYSGFDGTNWRIFYATSSDGLIWTKNDNSIPAASSTTSTNGRIPLGLAGSGDDVGTYDPAVIKDGSTYKMWYSGNDGASWRVYYATSSDGIAWTKLDNSIPAASDKVSTNGRIPLGSAATADDAGIISPAVIKDGDVYKMWYSGLDATNWRIFMALSYDGLTWMKVSNGTPAASDYVGSLGRIPLGGAATADVTGPYFSSNILKEGGKYKMWYTGLNVSTNRILHAEMVPVRYNLALESVIKMEGTNSTKLINGRMQPNARTEGLWHFEETSGTGAYVDNDAIDQENAIDTGDGADGDVTISTSKNINSDTIVGGRSFADGIAYQVDAPSDGATSVSITNSGTYDFNGIATGDEVLIINLQGATGDFQDVGNYEFKEVQSASADTLTFDSALIRSYNGVTGSNQKIIVQRVPNFDDLSVITGGTLTAGSWDGLTTTPTGTAGYQTGIVAFRATGAVSVANATSIHVNAKGYRGGAGGSGAGIGGNNGESYDGSNGRGGNVTGAGETNGGGKAGNGTTASPANGATRGGGGGGGADNGGTGSGAGGGAGGGYGGGGGGGGGGGSGNLNGGVGGTGGAAGVNAGGGGGGANNIAGGAGGAANAAGTTATGVGGAVGAVAVGGSGGGGANGAFSGAGGGAGGFYGTPDLNTIYLGSGGGGGGAGNNIATAGANGSNGGGIIFIEANSLTIPGPPFGTIAANGANGTAGSANGAGGGGAGAGGSVLIKGNTLTLGATLVTATGGTNTGVAVARKGGGGAGGAGRIRVESRDGISGTTNPAASTLSGIADLTVNGGVTSVPGVVGRAYSFNGTTGYLSCTDANCGGTTRLDPGAGAISMGAWIKTSTTALQWVISKGTTATFAYQFGINASGQVVCQLINTASGAFIGATGTAVISNGKWHHIACTYDVTTLTVYVDGASAASSAAKTPTQLTDSTADFNIGRRADNTGFFNGIIDEPFVSHTTFTADQVAEMFRMNRDHRYNIDISSTNLSGKTYLPFQFAADKPGTYIGALVGESKWSNYEPDSSTIGLWHLDESSGAGAYVKDSSGFNRHGTPTGTTSIDGVVGRARSFTGADDISLGSQSIADGLANATVDAWIYPTAQTAATHFRMFSEELVLYVGQFGGQASFFMGTGAAWTIQDTTGGFIPLSEWSHIAWVKSGTAYRIYINGILTKSGTGAPATLGTSANGNFISTSDGTTQPFTGYIDEVRIMNVAKTAEEIREAYDTSKRRHEVVVDFGGELDGGNLIANSGDTSFTVDATIYGLANKGDKLFLGDKIIVLENVNGVEYKAQGTVTAVTPSTGAVTISGWDAGSTFPAGGFTASANVFKWQREYWDMSEVLSNNLNASTRLTFRMLQENEGHTMYFDDWKSASSYMTNPDGSAVSSSTGNRYAQYRAIFSTTNGLYSPKLTSFTLRTGPKDLEVMRHGQWLVDGVKNGFWWAN